MKIKSSGTARATVLLETSPADLRVLADRIEVASQNVNSNRDHITIEITDQITLIYRVERPKVLDLLMTTEIQTREYEK
jgi:hypothetical protein